MEEIIAGVDEVGRGPLAGPVVAAAVILGISIEGLKDSKKLSADKRDYFDKEIRQKALAVGIGRAEVEEIDDLNILQASMLAMQRAVAALKVLPTLILVDGNRCPKWSYRSQAIVRGDESEAVISAASIVAKVYRDREMTNYHEAFPQYGFSQHKGYGTAMHLQALKQHGPCSIHRKSFAPVRDVLQ